MQTVRPTRSPATPIDGPSGVDEHHSPSTRRPRVDLGTPRSSPFDDGIPTLDLSKTWSRTKGKTKPASSSSSPSKRGHGASPAGRTSTQATQKKSNAGGSRIPIARGHTHQIAPPRIAASHSTTARHEPSDVRQTVSSSKPFSSSYTKDGEIAPPPIPSPEPEIKDESDDEDNDGEILARAAEMVRSAREEERRAAPQPSSNSNSSSRIKRKRSAALLEEESDRRASRQRVEVSMGRSLDQEIRFAEAQESTAAAMDLYEREQRMYVGSGSARKDRGFLKGGGAGGRAVYSSIAG